jgi:hypothetical protein
MIEDFNQELDANEEKYGLIIRIKKWINQKYFKNLYYFFPFFKLLKRSQEKNGIEYFQAFSSKLWRNF